MARRLISRIALAIGVLASVWTAFLLVSGGFDAVILGHAVTTHDWRRPLLLAVVAFAISIIAYGAGRTRREAWDGTLLPDRAARALASIGGIDDRLLVGVLAAAVLAIGLTYGSRTAGGADSYGYVSQTDLWLSGHLSQTQPWVRAVPWPLAAPSFAPLGYRAVDEVGTIAPQYSPGLPMLMAVAKLAAGHCAIFTVVPISGAVLTIATFGIGRRLISSRAGVIAAWLVATSPVFLYMLMNPMSDVPVAAAWAASLWCVLGGSTGSVIGAGLAAAMAVLIRPNLASLAAPIVAWLAWRAWRGPRELRARHLWQTVMFLVALSPGVLTVAVLNWKLNGSPLLSGYGTMEGWFTSAHVLPNLRNYTTWFVDTQTPIALAGVAALFVPAKWLWPRAPDRSAVVMCGLFVIGCLIAYLVFTVFDVWWYLRFLLPCWPLIMVGVAAVTQVATRSGRGVIRIAATLLIAALGVRGAVMARDRFAFDLKLGDTKYTSVAAVVRRATAPGSVIISLQHSGSLRYYGGRMTMRWDYLPPAWLDDAAAWLSARGAHPYALLEDWEVKEFKKRFGEQNRLGDLSMPAVIEYRGVADIFLFDLAAAPAGPPPKTRIETGFDFRCHGPVTPPVVAFK